jgi:putative glycosyltransferase (TIGR04372 family)
MTAEPAPPSPAATDRIQVRLEVADRLRRQNQLQAALTHYHSILAAVHDQPLALLGVALVSLTVGDLDQAARRARQALASAPILVIAWRVVSIVEGNRGSPIAGVAAARRAIALEPGSALGLDRLGYALKALHDSDPAAADAIATYEAALRAFDQAHAIDPNVINLPDVAGCHTEYGNAHIARGLYAEYLRRIGVVDNVAGPEGFRVVPPEMTRAIGGLVNIDLYVKMQILGMRPPHHLKAIAPRGRVGNLHYLKCWEPYVTIIDEPAEITRLLALRLIGDYGMAGVVIEGKPDLIPSAAARIQERWEAEGRPPVIRVTEEDRVRGRAVLAEWGLEPDDWFVGLHVREAGFHNKPGQKDPLAHRNASIAMYDRAVDRILERGGWVIRMGDPSMTPIRPRERVVDYARGPDKSEWMDVFLAGCSRFVVAGASGFQLVPCTLGVPCAVANASPMGSRPISGADIFIPKLYWSKLENAHLSFARSTAIPLGHSALASLYEARGIELQENSAEDIEALVVEMMESVEGTPAYTDEDERLQALFRAETAPHSAWGVNSRIGRDFLRKYAHLLEGTN